ncbi:MAG: spore coat polysaccharide biosynthesis protein SpsF [Solirubrobacteraceae bacterium]|jgi:spore coat polysaccharide biosynthesis protein SpsF|nr:spore coat polysaccharide biosynthesis protein SpsF [Solirubrobacteraceae bacterium]
MIAVVAQARMTSERLPGKVLRDLGGKKTTLEYVVDRITRVERSDLAVVATSVDPSDDPVEELCAKIGVACHRGPLADVAARYIEVADRFALDAFVRVTADSPLLDQSLVDRGIELFAEGGSEVVTNVFPSTFASGHSLEVVDASAYRGAYANFSEPAHFEHVTAFLYLNADRFRIRNFVHDGADDGEIDVSLDTEDDARLISAIIERMDRPHWEYDYEDVMELYRQVSS